MEEFACWVLCLCWWMRGCRAMWALVPLPSPGAPVVLDGLVICTSNGRFDPSQGIAWEGGGCSTSLKMLWYCEEQDQESDGSFGRTGTLVPPVPSVPLGEQSSSPDPASLDFPPCRNTLCDSRGPRSEFEGKRVYIVWGCGFFTLIAGRLISSFAKVRPGLEVTGFRICIPYLDGCELFWPHGLRSP